jgi:hypothetical protein
MGMVRLLARNQATQRIITHPRGHGIRRTSVLDHQSAMIDRHRLTHRDVSNDKFLVI